MPGLDAQFFSDNRRRLAEKLQGGVIVIAGHRLMQRKDDVTYPFEQESNFWYLTGVRQPQIQMVYDGQRDKCWLVRPELTDIERTFEGQASATDLMGVSGANEVINESQFEDILRQLSRHHSTVYTIKPSSVTASRMVYNPVSRDLTQRLDRIFGSVLDLTLDLARLRSIKQPAEIKAIEASVQLTTKTFSEVRTQIERYRYEYEIEAEFTYRFRQKNAQHAYEPIVASGNNACTLHYVSNDRRIKKSDFVLIDIGAQLHGYSADITRTYALGSVTKRQAELHAALQAAHNQIIASVRADMPVLEYQKTVDELMGQALVSVGLSTDGRVDDVRKYMPHAVSHGLGIDVHDSLARTKTLRPGMVLTVEPGIYIPEEKIGIRLEDNIVITEKEVRNLSKSLSTDW